MRQRMLQQALQQQHQSVDPHQQQTLPQQHSQQELLQIQSTNISNAQVYAPTQTIAYSQPEIRGSQYQQHDAQFDNIYANVFNESAGYPQYRAGDRSSSQIIHSTYSTPELYAQLLAEDYNNGAVMGEALPYHYKPPPPYPRASNSTPDLAIQTGKSMLSESPDLVSRRNLGMADLVNQSQLDHSIENLNEDFSQSANINTDNNSAIYMKPILSSENSERNSLEENSALVYGSTENLITDDGIAPLKQNQQRVSGRSQQSPCEKKSKVQIRYVSPSQAPPHSSSAEVATRKESFRRQMIANSSQFDPRASIRRSHRDSAVQSPLPTISDSVQPPGDNTSTMGGNCVAGGGDHAGCVKQTVEQTSSVESSSSGAEQAFHDDPQEGVRFSVGPLKTAALNGLTVSHPSMLAALNDETRAPKDERRKNLETQLEDGRVFVEFEKVFRRDPKAEFRVASLAENESRNRFRDVLPYEHNRVKLTPKKDNSEGYINASHIKMESGGVAWWFIAAQAPMPNTVAEFWQLIWEYNVHVVAMLTDIVELGKQKCCQYWPVETGEENKAVYGEYEVVLQYRSDSLYYVTNTICIRHKSSKTERLVWHLQYTAWPDHGCPEDIFGFLGFLDEVESVQRMSESDRGGDKFPIVVHCSAGVGRTGVVILTAIMKSFLEHNQSIDLPKALAELRSQRLLMVQTIGQYSFVYKTLIQYLKNTRLI